MRHPDPNFGYHSISLLERERLVSRLDIPVGQSFMRQGAQVLDSHIDALSWGEAIGRISGWATSRQSRFVTLCNVHSVVTASQERLSGPDLMWRYLAHAEHTGQSIFFYGSTQDTLGKLKARIQAQFPRLKLVGMESPPYRELSPEEDQAYVDQINQSGANVVFVGLGCPKQEAWMASHRGRIRAVMLGVGAAFDYHAGTIQRAPLWMQKSGLEWLHRLCSEPRRLFKRYLHTNSVFVYRTLKAMLVGQTGQVRDERR